MHRPVVHAYFINTNSLSNNNILEEDKDILQNLHALIDPSSGSSDDLKN